MSTEHKTVVFDLDGTLIDTLGDLTASVNFALSGFSFSSMTRADVRLRIGDGLRKLMERCLPEYADDGTVLKSMELFKQYYAEHLLIHSRPYAGIEGVLSNLSRLGVPMAVASNKDEPMVKTLIEHFFPGVFFAKCGMTTGRTPKPAPDIPAAAVGDRKNVVFVGDSETDYATARQCGYEFIGVRWGYGKHLSDDALWVQDMAELEKAILEKI